MPAHLAKTSEWKFRIPKGQPGRFLLLLFSHLAFLSTMVAAQGTQQPTPGLAWEVKGLWQVGGESETIVDGDSVSPGALLHPIDMSSAHSITILLADGQRIFYECFAAEDCSRGFRVPALYRRPLPFAAAMMARIQAGLIRQKQDSRPAPSAHRAQMAHDEALVAIGAEGDVQIEGLATKLADGHYTYDLRPIAAAGPRKFRLEITKSGPAVHISLPEVGLYDVTIVDDQNTPRIDFFVAAVKPDQEDRLSDMFEKAKDLMTEWNGDYYGWPIHDFLRAYLESIVLGLKPAMSHARPAPSTQATTKAAATTAEPKFSPRAGLLKGDTAISLSCDTPDAEIHFTVDGSQPLSGSPVYHAPIMVRGTELTIKAFALKAGKKDSPVVAGTFRIAD
jgi:hypothetical protein